MPLIKRTTKGTPLTHSELDNNFEYLLSILFAKAGGDITGKVSIGELIAASRASRLFNVIGGDAVGRIWRVHDTNHPAFELILSRPTDPDTIVAYYDMALDDTGAIIFRDRSSGGSGKLALKLTDTEVFVPGNLSVNGSYNGVNLTQLKADFDQLKLDFEELKAQVNNTTPPPQPLDPSIIYYEDFEKATEDEVFEGLSKQYTVNQPHSFELVTNPYGTGKVGRFELRQTDAMQSNGMRTEVLYPTYSTTNNDRWYAFSYYMPLQETIDGVLTDTWANDSAADFVGQWHQGTSNPPVSLRIQNSRLFMDVRGENTSNVQLDIETGGYTKDAWVDMVIHIRFDYTSNGLIELWRNGTKIITHNGVNMYNPSTSNGMPRWKMGIYKSPWNNGGTTNTTRRVLYLDRVRMGDSTSSYAIMSA